jgi:hypothetical protein
MTYDGHATPIGLTPTFAGETQESGKPTNTPIPAGFPVGGWQRMARAAMGWPIANVQTGPLKAARTQVLFQAGPVCLLCLIAVLR